MDRVPVAPRQRFNRHETTLKQCLRAMTIPTWDELRDVTSCVICHEAFLTGDSPEVPVKLPCSHIVGAQCLMRWLSPLARNGNWMNNSCPMCRARILGERCREPVQQIPVHVSPPRQPEPENKVGIATRLVDALSLSELHQILVPLVIILICFAGIAWELSKHDLQPDRVRKL